MNVLLKSIKVYNEELENHRNKQAVKDTSINTTPKKDFYNKSNLMSMLSITSDQLTKIQNEILIKYSIDVSPAVVNGRYIYTLEKVDYIEKYVKNDGIIPELVDTKPYIDHVRRESKKRIGKKFIVGEKYYTKTKIGTSTTYKVYELKKYIYSIGEISVCCLIMKQIGGEPTTSKFTLNRNDCIKYHIKYEEGLEVFPMEYNFIKIDEKTNFFNKLMSKQY